MPKRIAAVVVVALGLLWPAGALGAKHRAAHGGPTAGAIAEAIVVAFGPGTVVSRCHRFRPYAWNCAYSTPGRNVGIVFEPETTTMWYASLVVTSHRAHLAIHLPPPLEFVHR